MEQAFVRKLSRVLGITSRPTGCSRVYSAFIFCVITSSCMHILYMTGLEPLLNPNTDASLSIAYMFDFIARIARVVSYIIMHILTYKHANRFEKIYKKLQAAKQRVCGNSSTQSKDAFHFAMAFALIRLLATLTPVFSHNNSQMQSTWMDIPFHLKFVFNFYMELQLFVFCSMLELSFNSIRVRLSRLRKYAPYNSLTHCGKVLVDRWGLPKQRTTMMVVVDLNTASYSETVRTLRRAHADLCDLANKINSLFGVRLLVDITAQLLALLLRLKIVIIWIFNAIKGAAYPQVNPFLTDVAEMERALAALVLCPIHMGTVYSVVFYCTRTVKENEQVLSEIYRLLNHSLDPNDREELVIFASQLSHRKVQFTAAGVMPLDFTLLYSFIGVVTTYLVILTQFGASLSKYTMDVSNFGDMSRKNSTVLDLAKCFC